MKENNMDKYTELLVDALCKGMSYDEAEQVAKKAMQDA